MKKVPCSNAVSELGTDTPTEDYQLVDEIGDAGSVLVRNTVMHEMEFPESLKAIARADAGMNNIPLDECTRKGIVVFNTPSANANDVKELVIASMLLTSRGVVGGIKWYQSIKKDPNIAKAVKKGKEAFAKCEVKGKKLGVIGLGAISAEITNTTASSGMEAYGHDPFIFVSGAWGLSRDVKRVTSVDTIYQKCDYITVHVPLLDTTRGMINETTIDQMREGVAVLNFVRDLLVNDDDMVVTLSEGKVHKYVTDFPSPGSANMTGTIAIPHLGASTEESGDNCAMMAVQEMMGYLENGNIKSSMDYPSCSMGVCHAASHVAVPHINVPNMIGQITRTATLGNVSISDMTNKSRGQYAHIMLDLEKPAGDEIIGKLKAIDEVLGIRMIQ